MANISTPARGAAPGADTEAIRARARQAVRPRGGPTLDFATLLGVAGAFAVIAAAMALGGSPGAFLDLPAILIVGCGSFLVTTVSFTLREVMQAQRVMLRAMVYHVEEPDSAARQILFLADLARRESVLALQKILPDLHHNRFLERAIALVVDGTPAEDVERMVGGEVQATAQRHLRSAGVLRRAGEVAPTMGLIGTLVGLVQMLGNLEDPSAIGPAMAVALLTTFYGAVLANMVFLPLASKLERNSQQEAMVNQIYAIGAASVSRQENPRRLEMAINTILPPAKRVAYFD